MTKNDEEFFDFNGQVGCRECTLPRDEESSTPRGWIRGNTKMVYCIRSYYQITVKASKELRSEKIRYQTMHREDSRLSETPEPSIVSSVPLSLPMDAFNYVQFGWKWYVPTRVGHDILQTRSRSEKALDLAVGPP